MQLCMKRLDWDDLRLFLAIARAGTLTAAAERLQLSQPTAGRRLRGLEQACGVALFQRTPAGFRLTDEGAAMLPRAERMEEETLALERQFVGSDRALQGQLRLSSSDWFGRIVLAPHIATFVALHPQVTVELITDFRLLDLDRREADLVFRLAAFHGPDIVQRRFVHVLYGLFAARAYLDRVGPDGAAADGARHRLVSMDSRFEALPDVAWLRDRYPEARLSVRSNNREVQAEACRHGAGLAVLPRVMGAQYGLEDLTRAGDEPPGRDIWLGYHADLKRLGRLRSMVDHLSAGIGGTI